MSTEPGRPNRETPSEGEQLSSLVDGELEAGACEAWIARLAQDSSACREWTLLHLAGDALRSSEVASWHSAKFSARVAAVIADEPTVLAPAIATRRRRLLQRVVLPGAAAVAAVALIVAAVPVLRGGGSGPALQAGSRTPAAGAPAVAAAGAGQVLERSAQMEAYLAAHREVSDVGMMPPSAPLLRASTTLADEGR